MEAEIKSVSSTTSNFKPLTTISEGEEELKQTFASVSDEQTSKSDPEDNNTEQRPKGQNKNIAIQKRWNRALQKVSRSSLIGCTSPNIINESLTDDFAANSPNDISHTDDTSKIDSSPYNLEYCLRAIRKPSLRTFKKLKQVLETVSPDWIWDFVRNDGLGALFESLTKIGGKNKCLADTLVQFECVECVKTVMDTPSGLTCMIENKDFTRKFVQSLEKDDPTVKIRIFELLSAICVYSPEGYVRVIDVLEHYKIQKQCRYRFAPLVDELRNAQTSEYCTTLLSFINCIIISTETLDQRVRIRNEFLGLKIFDILNNIRKEDTENPDLTVQLDVFDQWKTNDDEQLTGPDGVDLNDHLNVFHAVFKQVCDTPQEIAFLATLQHLLQIDPTESISDVVWSTIEKLVYRATQLEKPEESDKLLLAGTKRLEKAVQGTKHCDKCQCNCHDDRLKRDSAHKESALSPVARKPGSFALPGMSPASSNPLLDEGVASPPAHAVPVPPAPPSMPGAPPPPPPVPPMGGGAPPPPPPPPGGAPPPPPLLNGNALKVAPVQITRLPQQMTPKPQVQVRKLQWSKIPAQKVVQGNNIWSRIGEQCKNVKVNFDELENSFKVKPKHVPKDEDSADGTSPNAEKKKKSDEITLLENKKSFQVNIFLRQFRIPTATVIAHLAQGDSEALGAEKLRGLRNVLPQTEEVDMLKSFEGDKTKLGKAERFFLQLLDLPNYKLRVEALLMKEEFKQTIEWLKPAIDAMLLTADQLKESADLNEILYTILLAGNFLNSGGYSGDAAGFKLSSLLKLTDVSAHKPRMNLLHFVVHQLQEKNPKLLKIADEFDSLNDAAMHSVETISTEVTQLKDGVKSISERLGQIEDESFKELIQEFLDTAGSDLEEFDGDLLQMEEVRESLAVYFCEDSNAFKLEECLNTFKIFFAKFVKAIKENNDRQMEEDKAEQRRKQREEQQQTSTPKRRQLSGDKNDKGRPNSSNSDDDVPIVDKLLGKIRQGNFNDSPDFQVKKVTKVTLDSEMPLVNGISDSDSRPSTPPRVDLSRSNSLRHSGGRRLGPKRFPAIDEDRSSTGKARSEDLNIEMDTDDMLNLLLMEGERPLRRRGSARKKTQLNTSLSLDRDRAPSPSVQSEQIPSTPEIKTENARRPKSPLQRSRTSPPNTPAQESPLVRETKPRLHRGTSHEVKDAASITMPAKVELARHKSQPYDDNDTIKSITQNQDSAPLPVKTTDDKVARLLENARLRSLEKVQKGQIPVNPVITETDLKSIATHPNPAKSLVNGGLYGKIEHNNNDVLLYNEHDPLRTDVEETIKQVETYGRDMLDNWDSIVVHKHEEREVQNPNPPSGKHDVREKYRKYLTGTQLEEKPDNRPVSTYDNTSTQSVSRYDRIKARFQPAEEEADTTSSRFNRSYTMPNRVRGGFDARKGSIEEEQQALLPRSEKYTRKSRLTGAPMLPSSLERGTFESQQMDDNVEKHIQHGTDSNYRWLSEEAKSTRGSRLQSLKERYSNDDDTDHSHPSYTPLTSNISEYPNSYASQLTSGETISPRSAKSDKEDSHSEASSKDEGFESASQRTSMSSNLEQEIQATTTDSTDTRSVDTSVDISRSVDSLVKNPNFALTETVNIDDLPSHYMGDKTPIHESDNNRTITNTPDSELNDESASSHSVPPTPSRTTSKYASDKATLPPTPKTSRTSKSPGRTSSVFSRLTQGNDKKSRITEIKTDAKSRDTPKSRSSSGRSTPNSTPAPSRQGSTVSGGSHSGSSTPTSRRKTVGTPRDTAATKSTVSSPSTSPSSTTTSSAHKPRKPIGTARTSISSTTSESTPSTRRPAKPSLSGVRSPMGGSRTGSRSSSRQGSTDDLSTPPASATFVRRGYGRQTMPASMRFNKNKTTSVPTPPERTTSIRPSTGITKTTTNGSTTPGTARRTANRNSKVAPSPAHTFDIAEVHQANGVSVEDKKKRTSSSSNVFSRLIATTPSRRLTVAKSPATTSDKKTKLNVKSTTKSSRC